MDLFSWFALVAFGWPLLLLPLGMVFILVLAPLNHFFGWTFWLPEDWFRGHQTTAGQ